MYNSVLFPTDRSDGATKAREHAIELAADQNAVLHVLNVVHGVAPAASLHEGMVERLTDEGENLVESVASEARERGVTVETAVVEGDPASTIVEYANANGIDVVVMPAHGRSELSKTFVGSVTDKVIRTGEVPVIVLKLDAQGD
ncbi:MAG: universal stress protein [Haloferacaceae archaeon]